MSDLRDISFPPQYLRTVSSCSALPESSTLEHLFCGLLLSFLPLQYRNMGSRTALLELIQPPDAHLPVDTERSESMRENPV